MKEFSWKNRSQVFIATLLLIAIWEIAAIIIDNSIYLPTVEVVVKNLGQIIVQDDFFLNIYYSMYRTLVSFMIALILALIAGIASSFTMIIRNILRPINALATSIPTMILVVLSLIWFDKNNAPYIVGVFIVFPLLFDAVTSSIDSVDKNLVEMAKVYKVSTIEIIRKIFFPVIKFQVLGMFISSFSLAFKVVIAGEVFGQPKYGIGTVIQYEKMNFNTEAIFAWIVIIALISFVLGLLQNLGKKSMFRWMT